MKNENKNNKLNYFYIILFVISVSQSIGLGMAFASNFFKDAYNVGSEVRGILEIPREIPGLICIFATNFLLNFGGSIFIAIVSQILAGIGIFALGLSTPTFTIMCIWLFINSMGMHLFLPQQEGITLELANENHGRALGRAKTIFIAGIVLSTGLFYIFYKLGWFRFDSTIKWSLIASAVLNIVAVIMLFFLKVERKQEKQRLSFDKKFTNYYVLAGLAGAGKTITSVFGPWLLIQTFQKTSEYIAILIFIGAILGMLITHLFGIYVNNHRAKNSLVLDTLGSVLIFASYFIISFFVKFDIALILASGIFIIDISLMQTGIAKANYLRELAEKEQLSQTLATGTSLEHVISIATSVAGGYIWAWFGSPYAFLVCLIPAILAFSIVLTKI